MNTNSNRFFQSKDLQLDDSMFRLIIAAWKIKNPGNMGQIIRLAHNLDAEKVIFIDDGIHKRESSIKKTAGLSYTQMKWEVVSEDDFWKNLPENYPLFALETAESSSNIFNFELPDKCIILAGNEISGLPEEVIERCHQSVFIPIPGGCKSLNVSHALTIAGFEWFKQKSSIK